MMIWRCCIEDSLTRFVRRMLKLDTGGRTIRVVKDQLARLSASSIRLGLVKEGRAVTVNSVGQQDGSTRVYVLPVTHTKPFDSENGIEILPQWKRLLRLDDQPSWTITSELNHFEWPGPDVLH